LVQFNGYNWVFRGDLPINGTTFVYDQLVSFMNQSALKVGLQLPSKFQLIDVSFLNEILPDEREDLQIERAFFQQNPSVGNFINWPLYGDLSSPRIYPLPLREAMAKDLPDWQKDDVPDKISTVQQIFNNKTSVPIVLYYHCEAGSDRTGEFSAAIYMQYSNMTLDEALTLDNKIAQRDIAINCKWSAEWYCWYLKVKLNYDLTCDE